VHHNLEAYLEPGRPRPGLGMLGWVMKYSRDREIGKMLQRSRKRLGKRAKKGFRGYPVATVALYGPDDTTATKLTVGIVLAEDAEVTAPPTLVLRRQRYSRQC
jgi:hypothetical protein